MNPRGRYVDAAELVIAWLSHSADFAPVGDGSGRRIWETQIDHPLLRQAPTRLVLPPEFPTVPAQIYVDRDLFLRLPHVERDGRVCLGTRALPGDFDAPVGAVLRVVGDLQQFLKDCGSTTWRDREFSRESTSYWAAYCATLSQGPDVYVDLDVFEGRVARPLVVYGHGSAGAGRGIGRVVVSSVSTDRPSELAERHGWDRGQKRAGRALFVLMPDGYSWSPSDWPRSLGQLQRVIDSVSVGEPIASWMSSGAALLPKPMNRTVRRLFRRPHWVFLVHLGTVYGFEIEVVGSSFSDARVWPRHATRVDPKWCITRDYQPTLLARRKAARVLVLGCGSLGSPMAELIARAGVGMLDLVDEERFEAPNVSRHVLGLRSIHKGKAESLAGRLRDEVPGTRVAGYRSSAEHWVSRRCRPGSYDLVIECTGESRVRTAVAHLRAGAFGNIPLAHAWIEPFCAAAHVVLSYPELPWPPHDPADERVNAAEFSDSGEVALPGCGAGFHRYGVADVWQAAGFAAERLLSVIDGCAPAESTVWSWVRSKAFFQEASRAVKLRPVVPEHGLLHDSVMVTRSLAELLV